MAVGKPFQKGNRGRPEGSANKVTQQARELFTQIMEGHVDNINESLEKIRKKDPARYLDVLSKFFPYFIPKKVEIETPSEIVVKVVRK